MRKFAIKLLIFSFPFLLLIIGFIINDPFRIFKHYDDYSENMIVIPNRDFVSSEVYKQNKEQEKYDSFIFGSSRTMGFRTWSWKKYIGENSNPFVFDASAETIFGINKKVKYLEAEGDTIRNALLLICRDVTFSVSGDNNGHLLIKHPGVAKTSWLRFYTEFFKSYFDVKFLAAYYGYKITGVYKDWMNGYIEPREIRYDPITNDVTIIDQDREIDEVPDKFYRERADLFYDRNKIEKKPERIISPEQENMLQEIKEVFDQFNTCYVVVVSPLYDQIPLHKDDLKILNNIYGSDKVFDYSGKNEITSEVTNYYEASHFRPKVGDKIMEEIYETHCRPLTHENTTNHTDI